MLTDFGSASEINFMLLSVSLAVTDRGSKNCRPLLRGDALSLPLPYRRLVELGPSPHTTPLFTMHLHWLLLTTLLTVLVEVVSDYYDSDYADNTTESCLPDLANRCFMDLLPSLTCHLEPGDCAPGLVDFCSVAADSLQCAADIIDTDCHPEQGQLNFDSWMQGLRAVEDEVCNKNNSWLKVLSHLPCFDIQNFLECVEGMTKVAHVVDLLNVNLNTDECNRLLIALPTCNVRTNPAHSLCYPSQMVVNEVIFTFFSHSKCGVGCPLSRAGASLASPQAVVGLLAVTLFITILYE